MNPLSAGVAQLSGTRQVKIPFSVVNIDPWTQMLFENLFENLSKLEHISTALTNLFHKLSPHPMQCMQCWLNAALKL